VSNPIVCRRRCESVRAAREDFGPGIAVL
jgi:hypothetical protein